jgi:hypothetical protein
MSAQRSGNVRGQAGRALLIAVKLRSGIPEHRAAVGERLFCPATLPSPPVPPTL